MSAHDELAGVDAAIRAQDEAVARWSMASAEARKAGAPAEYQAKVDALADAARVAAEFLREVRRPTSVHGCADRRAYAFRRPGAAATCTVLTIVAWCSGCLRWRSWGFSSPLRYLDEDSEGPCTLLCECPGGGNGGTSVSIGGLLAAWARHQDGVAPRVACCGVDVVEAVREDGTTLLLNVKPLETHADAFRFRNGWPALLERHQHVVEPARR